MQSFESATLSEIRLVRRQHLLLACVIGLLIGGVAVAFEVAAEYVAQAEGWISSLSPDPRAQLAILAALCTTAGAIAGLVTQRVAPEAGGSGIPHVKSALSGAASLRGARIVAAKFIGGALVIGSRFSLGREGPTVHLGAAVADQLSKVAKAPALLREHLVACGAGAGLAAAFNAPLAGFLFIIEELRREVSSVTLGMALIGTVLADVVVQFATGAGPSLTVPPFAVPSLASFPAIIIIALGSTVAALAFNQALVTGVQRMPAGVPLWLRGALMGAAVALCIRFLPAVTDDTQTAFSRLFGSSADASLGIQALAALLLAKMLLTAACYSTGVPGGIFAPMLVQGAIVGALGGKLLAPIGAPSETVCALVGMTAFFAASVRAPFTGVVLLAEMTNGFTLLFPLMAAALAAYLAAELCGSRPIYERLLEISRTKPRKITEKH